MFKYIFTNSSGILTSRIFGFVRDLLMASIIGAGALSDMFFVAFKLPNLFRRIFGEGAFSQAFLPSFFGARYRGGFALLCLLFFALVLVFLSLLVWIFAPFITKALAFGFEPEKIAQTAPLVAINFWYLLLVFIITLFGALLQYKRNFSAWAYSPALLNIAMICALLYAKNSEDYQKVVILSYGVLLGGLLQILLHIYPLVRLGFFRLLCVGFFELKFKSKEICLHFKAFLAQFLPALLGSSTAQIASFLDTLLASFLASGAISYLYYANRIFQLPLAVFAIATSTALFPLVARQIAAKNEEGALKAMKKAFWFLLALLGSCAIGGALLGREIMWLLFERGAFSRADSIESALVFSGYLLGLLPFGLARIFSLWFYSHKLQAKAAKISAFSLLFGVACGAVLMQIYGAFGLALGSSLGGFALFFISIYFFGFARFLEIIKSLKFALLIALFWGALAILILLFKSFIFSL